MKFLLVAINTKYIHSNPAIYSLRAYAGKPLQEHVELCEYTINQNFDNILADIYKRKPDAIAFSCYLWNIALVLELTGELRKLLPEMPIWLGGPEVSFDAPELLGKYPMLTGVMIGEGEETFRELLDYYVETFEKLQEHPAQLGSKQMKLQGIKGLCLRSGFTAPRPPMDINRIPFLYDSLRDLENKIIYYESSRGCPFRCSYCLSSIDKTVRFRDLQTVKSELQYFLDHKVAQVKFVDRTFNCNHQHAMAIWQYILENDNGVTNFHFEVSADILNQEEIALLHSMRPGLIQLEIGVQSVNPNTIRAINRTMNVEKLEKIVTAVSEGHNIHQHLDLIAGLPFEDYESFGHSFNRVYWMEPEQLQLGFLKVLKGSEMFQRSAEFGICYLDKPPYEVLFTNWLSYADVLKLKGIAEMVELYYNSNQFRHTLYFLEKRFASPFAMFEKMAEFYERKGYFTNSPARVYRYKVLLEFAVEWEAEQKKVCGVNVDLPEYQKIYAELLTYDMYLRENLKSRPEFAADPTPYKEKTRQFYLQEEQERKHLPDYAEYDHKQISKMTHLEVFHYPVWDRTLMDSYVDEEHADGIRSEQLAVQKDTQLYYILFDYQKRDPLTMDAEIHVMTKIE